MTRFRVAIILAAGLLGVLVLDQVQSVPLDPFGAPPLLALGSGQASGGAHCAALPPQQSYCGQAATRRPRSVLISSGTITKGRVKIRITPHSSQPSGTVRSKICSGGQ